MLPTEPTQQFALNVVVPIVPTRLPDLRAVLSRIRAETYDAMGGMVVSDPLVAWSRVESLHYARFVLLDEATQQPRLAFSTHFDGPVGQQTTERSARRRHFEQLVVVGRRGFDAVYGCCEGYPGASASNASVIAYLLDPSRAVRASAFYCGSRGRSRDQIKAEAELRRRASQWLHEQTRAGTLPSDPQEIRRRMLPMLGMIPPFPAQRDAKLLVFILAAGLVTWALSNWQWMVAPLLGLGVAAIVLRHKEQHDPELEPVHNAAERAHVQATAADENLFFQNALSNVVMVKAGPFRRTLLRVVLSSIDVLARAVFVHGKLGDIPSIHFAHWYLLDGGKRIAFVSNFDSSWESYLGDFIDQASDGLTAIWSNTEGYPKTRWLTRAGSRAGERFKAWARHIQVPTQVWYAASPNLSVTNINDNTLIRRGLADASIDPRTWLKLLS